MSISPPEGRPLRVAYLAVEATRQGHATFAHVHEIVGGLRRLGIDVDLFEPSAAARSGIVARLLEQFRVQARLWRRWTRYDAIYVRAHYTAFATAALARASARPIVQEVNGPSDDVFIAHPWTRTIRPFLSWIYRRQLAWAHAVVAVTPALCHWIARQVGRPDADVIPNGANLQLFSPSRTTTRHLPENFVVFFGALTAWQGVETLLAALAHRDWPAGLDLVVLGDGAMSGAVAAAARGDRRLHWLGPVPYDEVGGIVARARAGLVPKNGRGNRQETGLFPLKLFEIVSCGVPAIVTDFPGQADFIRAHECGLVIPPDAPEALVNAVRQLTTTSQAHEMGRRGRAAVAAGHSWEHRAEDTARVLRRVTSAHAATAAHLAG